MLIRFLTLIFASMFSINSHAEVVPVLLLPDGLKVNCEYRPSDHELVFLSNGNLRYLLPVNGKLTIMEYVRGADEKIRSFELVYSESDLVWNDFDNPINVDIINFKDKKPTSSDEINIDVYISGEFKGEIIYGMVCTKVMLNVPKKRK